MHTDLNCPTPLPTETKPRLGTSEPPPRSARAKLDPLPDMQARTPAAPEQAHITQLVELLCEHSEALPDVDPQRVATRASANLAHGQLSGRKLNAQETGASGRLTEDVARNRGFAKADAIRDLLAEADVKLEDTPQGVRWTRDKHATPSRASRYASQQPSNTHRQ